MGINWLGNRTELFVSKMLIEFICLNFARMISDSLLVKSLNEFVHGQRALVKLFSEQLKDLIKSI